MTVQLKCLDDEDNIEDIQKKKQLLGVTELSEVERRYSLTALTIFKERYLLKDNYGDTVERLDDLFKRVAVSAGLMEILYDPEFYQKEGKYSSSNIYKKFIPNAESIQKVLQEEGKDLNYSNLNLPYLISNFGDFNINIYHKERLLSRYIELALEGHMKVSYESILLRWHEMSDKYLPLIQKFYDLMANAVFLPNTPTLMNAGTKLGQNAACFTLRMEDSIEGITKTWTDVTKIFKSGGGIGINYSEIRPEGSFVSTTGGQASGPISYLKIVDSITGTIAQGGKRRGAAMGILNIDHRDIKQFINLKDNKTLENHNISICMDDEFFKHLFRNRDNIHVKKLMEQITQNAWKTGDPGMVFLENMNKNNLLESVFKEQIQVTNPCSEISMYPYESCILASINLNKFLSPVDNKFDLEEFINVTRTVTHFLDNIIDSTKYPIDEINKMTKNCRRIGVGFMGLADVLARLKIPYNSEEGFIFTEFISAVMTMSSLLESNRLAEYKGAFPLWYHKYYPRIELPVNALLEGAGSSTDFESIYKYFTYRFTEDKDLKHQIIGVASILLIASDHGIRNCSTTTIAPTGTLSMFADCSSGIEPLFSLEYTKKVTLGEFKYIDKNYEKALKSKEMNSKTLKKVFVTAMDIHPYDHIMMQSVAQRWITNGISKTINAPYDITPKMIENAYVIAWALGNKGITVYRDRCKDIQVLNNNTIVTDQEDNKNKNKNKKSNLKPSQYTMNKIMDLDNLPNDFKLGLWCHSEEQEQDMPVANSTSNNDYGNIKQMQYLVEQPDNTTIFLKCPGCETLNSLQRSGSNSCFICVRCGSSIGSCN